MPPNNNNSNIWFDQGESSSTNSSTDNMEEFVENSSTEYHFPPDSTTPSSTTPSSTTPSSTTPSSTMYKTIIKRLTLLFLNKSDVL